MSHYNTSYHGLEAPEKQAKALADIIDWFGSDRKFEELTAAFRDEPGLNQRKFSFFASMAGVQGYPVIAWWQHCFPSTPWVDEPEADIVDLVEYKQNHRRT